MCDSFCRLKRSIWKHSGPNHHQKIKTTISTEWKGGLKSVTVCKQDKDLKQIYLKVKHVKCSLQEKGKTTSSHFFIQHFIGNPHKYNETCGRPYGNKNWKRARQCCKGTDVSRLRAELLATTPWGVVTQRRLHLQQIRRTRGITSKPLAPQVGVSGFLLFKVKMIEHSEKRVLSHVKVGVRLHRLT